MELKKAIDRVAKVCPRKKEQVAFQAIRFLPNSGGPPCLYATDGRRVSLVKVDLEDLPDMLLPSAPLVTAAKDPGELEIVEAGYGKFELRSNVSTYSLRGMDFSKYPHLPPMPAQFTPVPKEDWAGVTRVFHAAGNEKTDPDLAVIHFTPDYVEATDKARLARVEVPGPWAGLVPAAAFKTWPKGEIQAAFTTTHAFFWIGDELRASILVHNPAYPKTAAVVPKVHEGPFALVKTGVFHNAVKQGMALSELGLVLCDFTERTLQVRAWRQEVGDKAVRSAREAPGYNADVPILHGVRPESGVAQGTMLLTGKYLDEALKRVETPNVKLGYGPISDPLRIESGAYVACVWQMTL